MKNLFLVLFLSGITCAMIFAQEGGAPGKPEGMPQMNRVGGLKEKLNLTDEQVSKVEAIFKENQKKMEALRKEQDSLMQRIRKEMSAIPENSDAEIEKLLTSEQKTTYKEMQENRKKGRGMGMPPQPGMQREGRGPGAPMMNQMQGMPPQQPGTGMMNQFQGNKGQQPGNGFMGNQGMPEGPGQQNGFGMFPPMMNQMQGMPPQPGMGMMNQPQGNRGPQPGMMNPGRRGNGPERGPEFMQNEGPGKDGNFEEGKPGNPQSSDQKVKNRTKKDKKSASKLDT